MLDIRRPNIPGESGVPETSSAERFFPVVTGKDVAAAEEVVAGDRGGSCCSGVWKVDPGEEASSMVLL